MKNITNKYIKKSRNKIIRVILYGIIIIFLSASIIHFSKNYVPNKNKNIEVKYLNDLIEESIDKEDKNAYLNINYIMTPFAKYGKNKKNVFYIVKSDGYYNIVYFKEKEVEKLLTKDLKVNPEKVTGLSKKISNDVIDLAINKYNSMVESEEEKINKEKFIQLFGDLYLDTVTMTTTRINIITILGIIIGIIGLGISIINSIRLLSFYKNIKRLDEKKIKTIQNEMDKKDTKIFNKGKIFLTKNYLIMLDNRFRVYKYNEVLWMYPYEQRFNGIRTNKAIKLYTNDSKVHIIANTFGSAKEKEEIYDDIWSSIASKNDFIKLGFTKENIKFFKDKTKEIKLLEKLKNAK